MSKGKAYANRKPVRERPESDSYSTPRSLTWLIDDLGLLDKSKIVYEPAAGAGEMAKALVQRGYRVKWDDLHKTKKDFLKCPRTYPQVCMNPPFSLFDEFVMKAKEVAPLVVSIAKTNFLGAYKRSQTGVWEHLKFMYVFNRQIDYRSLPNKDGLFCVGNLITGIFVWDRSWNKDWWKTSIVNVQPWAKLGQFKED